MHKKFTSIIVAMVLAGALAACGSSGSEDRSTETAGLSSVLSAASSEAKQAEGTTVSGKNTEDGQTATVTAVSSSGQINATELFTERDLTQTADTSGATTYTVSDGQDISITSEGVYVITGSASNATITVDAGDTDKVQIVLDGVSITNEKRPCIYVKNADKVFVTTTTGESTLAVTGSFEADGDTNTDAVIFAKDDLVLNGQGTLNITSTDNGISCKNDLKLTGGTYNISCSHSALEAKESISVADGTVNITACTDGLHAEDDDDDTQGAINLCGGTFTITAADDAIHGTTVIEINGGTYDITAAEGIEATVIRVNDGTINIQASDDGINAGQKSNSYTPLAEFNGGTTTIVMGAGDTDGVDSNGDITVNGGTINVSGQSTFDYDGTGTVNGGTVIENGTETDTLTNQMMGGGGGRGGQGGPGGHGGRGDFGDFGGFGH